MLYLTQSPQITGLTRCIMGPTDLSRERRLVKLLPSRMTRYATHNITQQGKEQSVSLNKYLNLVCHLMLNFISIYNFFRLWFMVSSSLTPIRLYSTLVWYPKLPTDWRQLSGRRCTTMTPTGTGVTGAGGRVWPRTGQVGLQRWSRWYWWWYSQAWWRGLEWADRVNSAPLVLPW